MSLEDMAAAALQLLESEGQAEETIQPMMVPDEQKLEPEMIQPQVVPEPIVQPEADTEQSEPMDLEEVPIDELPERPSYEEATEEEFAFVKKRPSWKDKTTRMPEISMPEDLSGETTVREEKPTVTLTDEQKAIFSYFMPVKGMEEQLCKVISGVSDHLKNDKTASNGNLIIQGGQGCGKTTLATSVIKVLQQQNGCLNGKIGKIQAEALNKKDIAKMLQRVAGGCLIIEQAGELSRQAEVTLSLLLEQDQSGVFVILEDTSKGIKKILAQDENFARKFTEQISVPIFTNDELVTFARSYARELGYKIDDMAVLALYNRISNIQRLDQATTLTEVKEIVDEAIERESHSGLKKAFSILTASRYTDDDRIVLREKDFE
jgi:ribosome maturation factor RimP